MCEIVGWVEKKYIKIIYISSTNYKKLYEYYKKNIPFVFLLEFEARLQRYCILRSEVK